MKFFKTTLKILLTIAALGALAYLIYTLVTKKSNQQTPEPSGKEPTT